MVLLLGAAGRAVVHGGLAEQRVLGQAAVLEVQEAAITSPRGTTISGGSENATAAAQTADLLSLDTGAVSPANQDPFSITSPGASGGAYQLCSISLAACFRTV